MTIGQRVTVVPVSPGDRNTWHAECPSLPSDWSCRLVQRGSAELLPNVPLLAWVLDIDPDRCHLEASDSNFGFLPISDRMRPRYVASLRHVAAALNAEGVSHANADHISEVKGMFSRSVRRDQWDWRAVHVALDEPPRARASQLARILGEVATALRLGSDAAAEAGLELLRREELSQVLVRAAQTISASAPRISGARLLVGTRHRRSHSKPKRGAGSVLSQYSKEKLDVANAMHSELLDILTAYLETHGHRIEANQFVDAFTRLKSGPAIFEAKSLTDENEVSQVRHGLSQLYEYRFRHGLKDASLWLLLSRKPKEPWLIEYLERDRDVRVLWLNDDELAGPSLERLLESGSGALHRGQEA